MIVEYDYSGRIHLFPTSLIAYSMLNTEMKRVGPLNFVCGFAEISEILPDNLFYI